MKSIAIASILTFSMGVNAGAQPRPAEPAPPKRYLVHLRYVINAPRDQHVAQYDAMIKHLKSLNFEFVPPLDQRPETDREDINKNELSGYVPSESFIRVLENENIASILLIPENFKLPDPMAPVEVRVQLASGFDLNKQREFSEQVTALLPVTGFRAAVGYDHRGYAGRRFTRVVGTIPTGSLRSLLKDLRRQPTGWLAPLMDERDLPAPLADVNPILITEVLPSATVPLPKPGPPPRPTRNLEKIGADLWALVQAKDLQDERVRVEVFLSYRPDGDNSWRRRFDRVAPRFFVEGQVGQIVTALVRIGQVAKLADLQDVSVIRLPRRHSSSPPPIPGKIDNATALKKSGLADLHAKHARGKGVRLAIIDTDFFGYQDQMKAKKLPANTRLVDLTTVQNSSIYPDPMAGKAGSIGHGTHCALAAALAAPEAEITLIRIDGSGPYQIKQVIENVRGRFFSESLQRRLDEITSKRAQLRRERELLLKERKKILDDFTDESDIERNFGFLGPVQGWIFSDRVLHRYRWDYQQRQEEELRKRYDRLLQLVADLKSLGGIQIVANGLTFNSGYSVSNRGALARWLESTEELPLVFQAAGDNRKQAWNGFFRDADKNGVMEFAPPGAKLGKGEWTDELNFLAFQSSDGKTTGNLPAGTKVRVTLQWEEPHDPDFFARRDPKDAYLEPLALTQIVVLRQRDPDGKTLPADLFEVVARSAPLPQRLDNRPDASVYEHVVDFTAPTSGRYAIRIERLRTEAWVLLEDETGLPYLKLLKDLTAEGIKPPGIPVLESTATKWELRPRLFVEPADKESSSLGRPVLEDFSTDMGTIGIPGDGSRFVTVGAAGLSGKPEPFTTVGSPTNRPLQNAIDVFAFDGLELGHAGKSSAAGTSLATSFAAGLAASLISSGGDADHLAERLRRASGELLSISNSSDSIRTCPKRH